MVAVVEKNVDETIDDFVVVVAVDLLDKDHE